MGSLYKFMIGWGIIIALFWGSTKLEGTRTITYYVLWLAIVLVLVTHASELTSLLQGTGIQGVSGVTESSANQ